MPDYSPLHHDLTFESPLDEPRAGALIAFLTRELRGRDHPLVVDIGCGWGELLLRVLARNPGSSGLGLDLDDEAIGHARDVAAERGLDSRATFTAGDAKAHLPDTADAAICIGASQVWGADSDDPQPLDYSAALTALRTLVSRGAAVVYGEAIWSQPPTPQATAALGGRDDEFVDLPTLVDLAVDAGFVPTAFHEAGLSEWDAFESGFGAAYARWLATHPGDHPDAPAVRERAQAQRRGYLAGYRGILGLAYLELLAV